MMVIRSLLWKEVRALRPHLIFGCLLIAAINILSWSRIGFWGNGLVVGLSMFTLQTIPLWVMLSGFFTLHEEWKAGTIHWLLTYPANGWIKAAAKLLAAGLTFISFEVLALMGLLTILFTVIGREQPFILDQIRSPEMLSIIAYDFLWAASMGLFAFLNLFLLSFVAYAAGRTVHAGSWLVTGITFFGIPYLGIQLRSWLDPLFDWLPTVPFYVPILDSQGGLRVVSPMVPLPSMLMTVICGFVLLFALAGWLLERKVEV